MKSYLESVKTTNAWNEKEVVEVIKSILNHYLGEMPTEVVADGNKYTPKEYLNNYLKLNMDDYVDVLSYMQKPYWQQVEYEVPDNWWHNKDYFNVPLDDFMTILKMQLRMATHWQLAEMLAKLVMIAGQSVRSFQRLIFRLNILMRTQGNLDSVIKQQLMITESIWLDIKNSMARHGS